MFKSESKHSSFL